jgi:uncharacterized protein
MKVPLFVTMMVFVLYGGSFFVWKMLTLYGVFPSSHADMCVRVLLVLTPVFFFVSTMVGRELYSAFNAFLYTTGAVWVGFLLYLFLASIVLLVLYPFVKHLSVLPLLGRGFVVLAFLVALFGIVNASLRTVRHFTVPSSALSPLWKGKTIVLFSDTHIGLVRKDGFLSRVVKLINIQKPDLVLLAGDLVDGPRVPLSFLDPLRSIIATYGVVYTPGNHEEYSVDYQKILAYMRTFTTTLVDESAVIHGTRFVGIEYARESIEATKLRVSRAGGEALPTIALLHDPKNLQALSEKGVALSVSGHTHCGQLFPFNLVVRSIYGPFTYGVNTIGAMNTVTTCGVGTAGPPLRVGNRPEIVVLHIQ